MEEFKIGDVVKHKIDGRKMVVVIASTEGVRCRYWNESKGDYCLCDFGHFELEAF